ncbi:MAG: DUF6785 family protein [Armatimonadota bacterium]
MISTWRPDIVDNTIIKQIDETAVVQDRGITVRSVIIGFIAIIPGVFWGVYGDVVSQTDLTSTSLMMPPVLILVTLLLINAGMSRIRPQWVLTRTELITIYAMLTVAVVLSGMGMLQFLLTTLNAVPHYSTPENRWDRYLAYVPPYALPKLSAVEGFYKGGELIPWSAWKSPIILWSGFLFSMLFCMVCINSILRKQWTDMERLSYPIVQLPLQMTDPNEKFFKNRIMWLGFIIAAGLETLNSLHTLYPNIPYIQLRAFDLAPSFTTPPWNAIGYFPTTFYPLAIGLGFMLATDISFSCWFFYLLTKLENVFTASVGWKAAGGGTLSAPPYLGQQGMGAFIGITVMAVYFARHHLRDVYRSAVRGDRIEDSSEESASYRTLLIGLLAGFGAMVGFCILVGMSPFLAVAYIGLYLVFATTITRLRAEAGPAWTMGPDLNAMDGIVQIMGSRMFSQQNLVSLAYFNWFSIEMRCCPMPTTAEGMKMAQAANIRQRTLTIVMLAAIVAGIAVGFWMCLAVWYNFGAGSAKVEAWRTSMGRVPFDKITSYIKSPSKTDIPAILATGFGTTVTLVLSYLRSRFVWFPFHPAGYVLANTSTMYWLWCPFLIAWTCKVIVIKYGGIRGYRAAVPFFLGLVLGDYMASSLWALAGSIFGINMYRCFPC